MADLTATATARPGTVFLEASSAQEHVGTPGWKGQDLGSLICAGGEPLGLPDYVSRLVSYTSGLKIHDQISVPFYFIFGLLV